MQFIPAPRPSPIVGRWYAGDPEVLGDQVDAYIDQAKKSADPIPGKIIGLVAPHAGHVYSGATAGYAYQAIKGDTRDLVVVLSPFHQYFPGDLLTTAFASYQTPLGDVPVAEDLLTELDRELQKTGDSLRQVENDDEHSLEIQLPFLQRSLAEDFTILPLMLRSHNSVKLKTLSDALYALTKARNVIFIASTDLSHFHPERTAKKLDAAMLAQIEKMSPEGALEADKSGRAAACGVSAVAAMLWTTLSFGAHQAKILHYSTSADVTGNWSSVVGYGSAAIVI